MFGLTRRQSKRVRAIDDNITVMLGVITESGVMFAKTLFQIRKTLQEIKETMATQDDINRLAAQEAADVQAIADDLDSINAALTATSTAIGEAITAAVNGHTIDIAALENNQAKLDAAATALGGVANAISALVPAQGSPANPAQGLLDDPAQASADAGTVNDHSDNG